MNPGVPRADFDLAFLPVGREFYKVGNGVIVNPLAADVYPLTGGLMLLQLPGAYWLSEN